MKQMTIIKSMALAAFAASVIQLQAVTTATGEVAGGTFADAVEKAKSLETPAQREARTAWWRDARYGMFIHWDMSSIAGTEISWSRKGSKPLDITGNPAGYVEDPVYDNLYKKFNPTNFDATAWVKLAKAAGMKYIVFTSKHHGGICMWDTKLTDYSIMHTPFKRDVLKELADACHAEGLRFGIYYSPRDWHHPDYGIGDNSKYVAYMDGQMRELLTNYGTVDVLWFDSYGKGDPADFWHVPETWALIKSLQPQVMINSRLKPFWTKVNPPRFLPVSVGDFDTPEQKLGKYQDTRLWESCMTVVTTKEGGGWSYRPDGKVKSFEETVRMLVSCATGDGNLLLDVGPDSTGLIPADQSNCILKVGEWLKQNGESIYGTRGGPFKPGEYGGTTRKEKTIYVHIVKWPESGVLKLPKIAAKLVGARLLRGGKVDAKQTDNELEISVAEMDRKNADTVVALEFDSDVMKFSAVAVASAEFGEMTTLDSFGGPSSGTYHPTEAEKARIEWWRDAKFGLFMHWGLYSKMAGYWKGQKVGGGEWALKLQKLPIEEYRALAKEFNPVKFNADEWVLLAKSAGMKYIIITSKHHDGFSMFGTKVTPYNIVDATPFKRDPMQELKEACDRHGIKFGLYYSHAQDWNEPDGYGNNWSWPGYKRNMDKYLDEKSIPQIRELCEKYHPAILWFDTAGEITPARAEQISKMARELVPSILINSRIQLGQPRGLPINDFDGSGDNEAFPQYHNVPWELCGTVNKSWAYKEWDKDFRPVSELLFHLIDAVSKNGNYLLNVGPTAEGVIIEPYASRLRAMGDWLKVNGEAIYGCGGTAWGTEFGDYGMVNGKRKFVPAPANWRCTTKPGKVYIHVLNWPKDGKLELPALKGKIITARLLADSSAQVKVEQTANHLLLSLPEKAPDAIASVVCLEL